MPDALPDKNAMDVETARLIAAADFRHANAPYPTLPSHRPTKGNPSISHSDWEPDPDAPPIYRKWFRTPRQAIDWVLFGVVGEAYPSIGGWRRKRFEKWYEDDRAMGRWTWERRGV